MFGYIRSPVWVAEVRFPVGRKVGGGEGKRGGSVETKKLPYRLIPASLLSGPKRIDLDRRGGGRERWTQIIFGRLFLIRKR